MFQGIIQAITELNKLSYLDAGGIQCVNNSLLDSVLNIENRKITSSNLNIQISPELNLPSIQNINIINTDSKI